MYSALVSGYLGRGGNIWRFTCFLIVSVLDVEILVCCSALPRIIPRKFFFKIFFLILADFQLLLVIAGGEIRFRTSRVPVLNDE